MTKEIPLNKGYVTLVDDADYEKLISIGKWQVTVLKRVTYARHGTTLDKREVCIAMHRVILDAPLGVEVDHINGNGLDNRRENLRLATQAENQQNRRKQSPASSKYKGVCWNKHHARWTMQIQVNGVRIRQHSFTTPADAARAYNQIALEHFGEFARINIID